MKKPKPVTVTIGIPAHNEEANIAYLLESILRQKGDNFVIEKIYVLCDGCTDATAKRARKFSKKHPIITVLDDGKRKGKIGRLNQLYRMNKSKFVFSFDGDVVLKGHKVIERMISAFKAKRVVLVSGNNQPVKAETLIERIYNAGFRMWYEIRKDYKGGNNIANIHGCAVALECSFAKSFKFPKKADITDPGFLFLMAKERKGGFRYVKDAVVHFRSVNNLGDFFLQGTRNLKAKHATAEYFGDWVYEEYYIPKKYKVKGIIKMLFTDPVFTALSLILGLWLRVFPPGQLELETNAIWEVTKSTKRVI